jgi:hypothetical protein
MSDSQFGSQEWLIYRAVFFMTLPSMSYWASKKKMPALP